ncbi:Ceramidase [Pseudooceanicola marinus]|uniref:Ceramidase n=1 Tax=Pseudooceanicola marinus TaxID=396013 RepID=A0A1X6Z6G1_9RHOB|nr:ceramidase domain-containing protein [Pseudooceanicola marinus]PJE32177.1 hypothetical protein CVM50_04430 [Pseudooceanicola marinus]SLN41948.1 Ceramidase [Pseudooceanicola marinus]
MDWSESIDAYCERLGPEVWAEPVNALTNLAFILAALWAWSRVRGMATGQVLAGILFVIGVGSGLFHTLATAWASMADTLPIVAFILVYIYAATRDFLHRPRWQAGLVTLAFPFAAGAMAPMMSGVPLYGASAGYLPVPLMIAAYALILARRAPATARGLAIGAGILVLSLTFRSLDMPLCGATGGLGTHFLWHILNAVMLAWMIEVWRRHQLRA